MLMYDNQLDDDFVSNIVENFTGCDASECLIQLNEGRRMALVSFSQDVDAEAVKEKACGKLQGNLQLEHPPVNNKVIIHNLPLDVDTDTVTLYFESEKLCPTAAPVKNVDIYDDGPDHWIAVVEFEESSAVDHAVREKHPNLAKNLQLEIWSPLVTLKCTKLPDSMPASSTTSDGEPLAENRLQNTSSKSENVDQLTQVSKMPVTVGKFTGKFPAVSASQFNQHEPSICRKSGQQQEHRTDEYGPIISPHGGDREPANRPSISCKGVTVEVKNKAILNMMDTMLYAGGLLKEFGCDAVIDRPKSGIGCIVLSGENETKLLTLDSMLTAFANERLYTRDLPISPVLAQRLLRYSAAWVYKMMRNGCDKGDVMAFTEQSIGNQVNQPLVVALKQTVADRAAKYLFDHLLCGKVTLDEGKLRRFTASSELKYRLKEIDADRPVIVQSHKSAITVIGVPSFVVKVVGEIHDLLS